MVVNHELEEEVGMFVLKLRVFGFVNASIPWLDEWHNNSKTSGKGLENCDWRPDALRSGPLDSLNCSLNHSLKHF